MKKIKRWFKEIFDPRDDLDMTAIGLAMNEPEVRTVWLMNHLNAIHDMNLEIDKRLLLGSEINLVSLSARRKAFQDVLEGILSAKRQVAHGLRQNPRPEMIGVNLDRVTA